MTRVLVIQTASAKRLKRSVESILAGRVYPQPEITVLCEPDSELLEHFSDFPQIQVIPAGPKGRFALWKELRRKRFDIVRIFWTGEKKYRSLKLAALWLWPCPTDVESGDGGVKLVHDVFRTHVRHLTIVGSLDKTITNFCSIFWKRHADVTTLAVPYGPRTTRTGSRPGRPARIRPDAGSRSPRGPGRP